MGSQFNPAIGAAEGFASGASREYEAGLDFVTRLRAAAQQQAAHDDMMRQESFKNALELAGKGAVPLTQDPTGGTIAKGGLGKRTVDNPAAQGVEGMTVTDPQGRQYKIPNADQKAKDKLTDANSFTLTDELAKQAGPMGAALKVGQQYPLSTLEHLNQAIERERAATERTTEFKTRDQERLATESEREKDRQDARTESARRYAQTEKDRQDARTESQRRYNETQQDRQERLAETKRVAQEREDDRRQATIDKLTEKYEKTVSAAKEQRQTATGHQATMLTENGKLFKVPGTKDAQKPMTPEWRTNVGKAYMDAKGKADDLDRQAEAYHQQIVRLQNGGEQSATAPAQLPGGHKVGDTVKLKNGTSVTISKINPDGTFEGQ